MKTWHKILAVILAIATVVPLFALGSSAEEAVTTVTFSSKDNCKTGILAHFDAEENAGEGIHDPAAATWKNLGGSMDATVSGGTFKDDYLDLGAGGSVEFSFRPSEAYCVELICDLTLSGIKSKDFMKIGEDTLSITSDGKLEYETDVNVMRIDAYDGTSVLFGLTKNVGKLQYEDGTSVSESPVNPVPANGFVNVKIAFSSEVYGKIYAIRIYDHILNNEELTTNVVVDTTRFFENEEAYLARLQVHVDNTDEDDLDSTEHVFITDSVITSGLLLKDNVTYIFTKNCVVDASETKDAALSGEYKRSAAAVDKDAKAFIKVLRGVTVTFKGADAQFDSGAGAGICVPDGSTLIIKGEGSVIAIGGKAGKGQENSLDVTALFTYGFYYGVGGGGAAAGIGGCGGEGGRYLDVLPENGMDCGKICIMDGVNVNATAGAAETEQSPIAGLAGQVPVYGIGGGGAGGSGTGTYADKQAYCGKSGSVYISENATVSGRSCYYFASKLYQVGNEIWNHGLTVLTYDGPETTNWATSDAMYNKALKLALALKEASDHNALHDYTINVPSNSDIYWQSSSCHGAYKVITGSDNCNWYKDFVDNGDGYFYLIADSMYDWVSYWFNYSMSNEEAIRNPYDLIERCFSEMEKKVWQVIELTQEEKSILHELMYSEAYCEPEGGNRTGAGYVYNNQTTGSYAYHTSALIGINLTYTTVSEANTPRSVSWYYDTQRAEGSSWLWYAHYYYRFCSALTCYHGKAGINNLNWMGYLPQNMSIAEVNIPGTHDSGTYNMDTPFVNLLSQCQERTIKEQMNDGLRFFDIRLEYKERGADATILRNFTLAHGPEFCETRDEKDLTLNMVFDVARDFVAENASEFVILMLQRENGDEGQYNDKIAQMKTYLKDFDDVIFLNKGDAIPTVGQAKGHVIVIESSNVDKYEDEYDTSAGTKIERLENVFNNAVKQDLKKSSKVGDSDKPIRIVFTSNYHLEAFIADVTAVTLPIVVLTTWLMPGGFLLKALGSVIGVAVAAVVVLCIGKDMAGTPYSIAKDVNAYLNKKSFDEGKRYGWIAMNFYQPSVAKRIYLSNAVDWSENFDKMDHEAGEKRVASIVSNGSIGIIIAAAVLLALTGAAGIVYAKKKKETVGQTEKTGQDKDTPDDQ